MKSPLNILHLEDDLNDAKLIKSALITEGLECNIVHVSARADYIQALEKDKFDIILADYKLPDFDGLSALTLAQEKYPDIPFILISGTIGEEAAIESLKAGATDYVLKQRLSRLAPVVRRALKEAEEQRQHKQAAETLKESEGILRAVTESAKDAIIMIDHKGDTSYWNPAAERIFGYGREEALGRSVHKLLAPEKYYEAYLKAFPEFARTGRGNAVGKTLELTGLSKTGEEIPIELSLSTILIEGHWHAVAVIRDITERRKAEEEIQKRVKELEEFYSMAVTREIKMIELKKEIESLKEELLKYKKE